MPLLIGVVTDVRFLWTLVGHGLRRRHLISISLPSFPFLSISLSLPLPFLSLPTFPFLSLPLPSFPFHSLFFSRPFRSLFLSPFLYDDLCTVEPSLISHMSHLTWAWPKMSCRQEQSSW